MKHFPSPHMTRQAAESSFAFIIIAASAPAVGSSSPGLGFAASFTFPIMQMDKPAFARVRKPSERNEE